MLLHVVVIAVISQCIAKEIYSDPSDVNIALILNKCDSKFNPYGTYSLINAALWTTQRLNFLEIASPLSFGITITETCSQKQNIETLFQTYNSSDDHYLAGVISEAPFAEVESKLCDILGISRKIIPKLYTSVIKSTVEFMTMMNWYANVTVVVPSESFLSDFNLHAKMKSICVNNYLIVNNYKNTSTDTFIFFGNKEEIYELITTIRTFENYLNYNNLLIVPLDYSVTKDLPEDTYIMMPNYGAKSSEINKSANIVLTPQLFDVASSMLNYANTIGNYVRKECNHTEEKIECLKYMRDSYRKRIISPVKIMEMLKIQPLEEYFVYNIYTADKTEDRAERMKKNYFIHPFTTAFTYNVVNDKWLIHNVSFIVENLERNNDTEEFCRDNLSYCMQHCRNYQRKNVFYSKDIIEDSFFNSVYIRSDSWVYTFLSLSALGILFCIAILIFLFISICKRNILEGNPTLTIFLLVTVMFMFVSILPFCLKVNSVQANHTLCKLKGLAITVSYALAFSLILSRSILLASASKELGFMSHISGSVESFLCLFIFGVQAALCLQITGERCLVLYGNTFLFLMAYNIMLLLLLLCLCPLIYKCQRNFRESKYFVIATCIISVFWCLWIPAYCTLEWKEPILCFGLVSTASILLGSIFVPRTYQMTIAVTRDQITSRFPSLAVTNSAMDIYSANTQPVYDCVNVAAINAVNVASAGVGAPEIQQPDLYSCPALPSDDNIDFRCDSPLSSDKVTRF